MLPSLVLIPMPGTVVKHHPYHQTKRHTHATVQLHNKVSTVYHQGLLHHTIQTISHKFYQISPARVELSWAMHSHRSSRSQPCGQPTCKASRITYGGIHDFLSYHKKSIRHITLPVHLPGATDQLTNTHDGSTKQNSWDHRLNSFI
jgi:hypothetical protein